MFFIINKYKFIFIIYIYINFELIIGQKIEDSEAVLPSYKRIRDVVDITLKSWANIWTVVHKLKHDARKNSNHLSFVSDIYPKLMKLLLPAHHAIKQLDWDIRFRRKPAPYLDVLMNISNIDELHQLSKNPKHTKFGLLKLRWIEISSTATQMNRFYNKRMRDIFNGGKFMKEIAGSFITYKSYIWSSKEGTNGIYDIHHFSASPGMVSNELYFDDASDVFQGLRKLMDLNPYILRKNHFERGTCEGDEEYMFIEPNGTDLPFYLLYYLCLVDVKEFMMQNFRQLHNNIFYNIKLTNETDLIMEMSGRVERKIFLFDNAMGMHLIASGPMYPIRPGIARCDPPPRSYTDLRRNLTLGVNYEKLTNFIKVFVSPEQELHKSGTCRITCDLLDVTYSQCDDNDIDCKWERERECLLYKGRCDKFSPPCPTGHYKCQNSTALVSVCPSNRPDRLYEYIKGEDPNEEYQFGSNKSQCKNPMKTYQGGWKMEEDVLLTTPHFCEICTCYCFEPLVPYLGKETTRYFSLRSVQSKVKENRIVVGIKLHRVKDQIHIAIADAIAQPHLQVNQSTIVWHYPKYETDPDYIQRLGKDMRTMNLDDVVTPSVDRIVTGVRFYNETYVGKVRYNYIGIEIMTHQLDSYGQIIPGSGLFRRNGNSTVNRKMNYYPTNPETPDDPINAHKPSLPDSTSNEYLVFVGTSLEKDAAQSTIPYFDVQHVQAPDESTWLRGIGLFHKGTHGYGGFLGFKIIEHRFR